MICEAKTNSLQPKNIQFTIIKKCMKSSLLKLIINHQKYTQNMCNLLKNEEFVYDLGPDYRNFLNYRSCLNCLVIMVTRVRT